MPTPTIQERIKRYYSSGPFAGILALFLIVLDIMVYILISWLSPANEIEKAVNFPHAEYRENMEKYGDHSFNILEGTNPQRKR